MHGAVHDGAALVDEGVPRARRVVALGDSSSDEDESFQALYLKYGVTPRLAM